MRDRRLLDRDDSLHAHRDVRRAVVRVRASRDLGERHREVLAGGHEHVRHQIRHLRAAQVRRQLRLHRRSELCAVERHVVRTLCAHHDELDAVADLDREVRGLETIALGVADHLDFVRLSGDGGELHRLGSDRGAVSRRGCFDQTIRADDERACHERQTLELHD